MQAQLSNDEISTLRSRQAADEKLYKFFSEKLDQQVKEFGLNKMKRSMKEIRRLSGQVNEFCRDEGGESETKRKKFSPQNKSVVIPKIR